MLNDSYIEDYRNSGVIVLRGILNDWIEVLQRGVERNLKEPGEFAREYVGEGEQEVAATDRR